MRVARGEIKKIRATSSDSLGVADGTRTRDVLDHNQVLYQLNYSHHRALASNGLTVAALRRRGKFRSPLPVLNTSRPPRPSFHSRHHPTASPFPFYASRARLPPHDRFLVQAHPAPLASRNTAHSTTPAQRDTCTTQNTWGGSSPRSCPPHSHFSADHQKARTAMASAKFPSASGVASKYRSASTSDTSITWKDPSLSGTTSTRLNSSCSSRPIRERM